MRARLPYANHGSRRRGANVHGMVFRILGKFDHLELSEILRRIVGLFEPNRRAKANDSFKAVC
jgi:hypothetical protein